MGVTEKGAIKEMPKRGENIRKRKDGRWEARFKHNGKDKSVYAKTYYEVKEKKRIALNGPNPLPRNIMMSSLCLEWLDTNPELNHRQYPITPRNTFDLVMWQSADGFT